MDRVRLAIVGCGNICQLNAPGYLEHPRCDVVALFEIHGSRGILWVTRCTGEMLDLPPVMLIRGTETTSYQVPMDWRTGFDGAARDFVDGLLEGRQPAQDVLTAKKVLQVPLAIYEANRLRRPVAPDSMK